MIDSTRNDMLEFLQSKNLPAYFQVKSHIILSVAEEQNPAEAKSHLFKDIEALEVAKQTETHNRADAGELRDWGRSFGSSQLRCVRGRTFPMTVMTSDLRGSSDRIWKPLKVFVH